MKSTIIVLVIVIILVAVCTSVEQKAGIFKSKDSEVQVTSEVRR